MDLHFVLIAHMTVTVILLNTNLYELNGQVSGNAKMPYLYIYNETYCMA